MKQEKSYLFLLAEIILKTVEKYDNLKTQIVQQGHFNGRVNTIEQMSNMVTKNMVRYLTNVAMGVSREDFYAMMMRLTDEFYRAAESKFADEINQAHARKKGISKNQTLDV